MGLFEMNLCGPRLLKLSSYDPRSAKEFYFVVGFESATG